MSVDNLSPNIIAVVLAAGRSTRMGDGYHKLLATFDGVPLIRRTVSTVIAGGCSETIVVTGNRHSEMIDAIGGLRCLAVRNEDVSGMASSIRIGVEAAIQHDPDGIMIVLADMPLLAPDHLSALISSFRRNGSRHIVRAISNGVPGHPVIFPRQLYSSLIALGGDRGAKVLMERDDMSIVDLDIGVAAVTDVDCKEQMVAAGGIFTR